MLTLAYFTKFPSKYKDREKFVNHVTLENIKAEIIDENKILITSNTKKGYRQEIELEDNKISLRSRCKVSCTCESFKFDFAHAVFRAGSLLNPISFIRSVVQRPKQRNQYDIPSGCKHIVALARAALKIKI